MRILSVLLVIFVGWISFRSDICKYFATESHKDIEKYIRMFSHEKTDVVVDYVFKPFDSMIACTYGEKLYQINIASSGLPKNVAGIGYHEVCHNQISGYTHEMEELIVAVKTYMFMQRNFPTEDVEWYAEYVSIKLLIYADDDSKLATALGKDILRQQYKK